MFPVLSGDWHKDGPDLLRALRKYFDSLELKSAITLSEFSLEDSQNWTPVLTFATPGDLAVSYSVQRGRRVKFGGFCYADFGIVTSAFTFTTATGALEITGLTDVASTVDSSYIAVGTMQWGGVTKANYTHLAPVITSGSSIILANAFGSGQAPATIAATDTPTGGTVRLRGSILYRI